ncbi:LacI family DNA-binding transcriptional regulator [Marinomonas sp. 15G1-11]|uniref:LacI family DNA-binding transcriptional regulator n=1 Tax=Marinomonas phaeophyticola TaxID=3004091 RepID=A0ABT4JWL5_9GAMM|nr:LacI family DNA-binding transcriptional regulator [Marinomonas sp. 15G1-11]MCZ2722770.1 LacI family DNA-binding transcriptional regulator [Marinomonas sp. 15G1-11]
MKSTKQSAVTAQDVADLAGVSRAAVSRTFTKNGSVSTETREKVEKAAAQLGYQINFLAQGLNRKRSMLIGVVVARLSDPFRSQLLEGLLNEIQARGYQALVTEVGNAEELEATIRRFTQFRVSGVIVTSGQPPIDLIKECIHFNIPVVGINRYAAIPNVDFVCSDNVTGAQLAAQQLIKSGCKSIGWLNYQYSTWGGITRGEAFSQVLQATEPWCYQQLVTICAQEDGYEGGRKAAHEMHKNGLKVDGIYCANALLACGFLDGMREHGMDAPNDFHIIGFDDTPQTAQYSYRLSTIRQDVIETAKRALWCLESRAQDASLLQRLEVVPVSLVLRNTSPESSYSVTQLKDK